MVPSYLLAVLLAVGQFDQEQVLVPVRAGEWETTDPGMSWPSSSAPGLERIEGERWLAEPPWDRGEFVPAREGEFLGEAPGPASWSLTAAWIGGGGGANAWGIVDVALSRTWSWGYPDEWRPLRITPIVGWHALGDLPGKDLPSQVFDVAVPLSWRFWETERGGVSVGLTPGLYGDFRRVSSATFQLTGWLTGDLQLNESWTLLGGIALVRQLRSNWLPIGGVIWTPTEDWQIELLIPRPRIARRLRQTETEDVWLYVAGQYGGGAWSIDDGAAGNQLLSYSDFRLVGGVNVWRASGRELMIEAGYVFSRELVLANEIIATPQNSWLLQAVWVF